MLRDMDEPPSSDAILPKGLAGVVERDIDLLLMEECYSSETFLQWFVESAGVEGQSTKLVEIDRSVTTSSGESDLELVVESDDGERTLVMVENKIGASFQPRQAERYQQRGPNRVSDGSCSQFTAVLVAPQAYLGESANRQGFDVTVSYEAILEQIRKTSTRRSSYKAMMLNSAIHKSTHGYVMVENNPVTEFWRKYHRLASRIAPELAMPEPKGKPATSFFVRFTPLELPKGIVLLHKMPYGRVDLQFAGLGDRLPEIQEKYAAKLADNQKIERAHKSAVIRVAVPRLDIARDFDEQAVAVREGICAARDLLNWWKQHRDQTESLSG